MKLANNSGASYIILLGQKVLEGGFVIKDLQAEGLGIESKQREVKEEELVEYLKNE